MGQTPLLMASSLCLRPENMLLVVSEVNPGRPQSPHDYCPIIPAEVLEPTVTSLWKIRPLIEDMIAQSIDVFLATLFCVRLRIGIQNSNC